MNKKEFIIKEKFDNQGSPIDSLIIEIFKEYCIEKFDENNRKGCQKLKGVI